MYMLLDGVVKHYSYIYVARWSCEALLMYMLLGGVVELLADSLMLDGELHVSGGDAAGPRGGGGGGGSVYIKVCGPCNGPDSLSLSVVPCSC
ncbi:hypothetical protein DPMN_003954 [Dreissena polymorpha]|uniref:Uncharacterized protein n=1 Tax=Dreissena polymorpha TaxID=45954 RepID=A0A9D4MLX4_DREPO|nr:hypothetical protein DPMN_003954 [Dreissena polymorpha]